MKIDKLTKILLVTIAVLLSLILIKDLFSPAVSQAAKENIIFIPGPDSFTTFNPDTGDIYLYSRSSKCGTMEPFCHLKLEHEGGPLTVIR